MIYKAIATPKRQERRCSLVPYTLMPTPAQTMYVIFTFCSAHSILIMTFMQFWAYAHWCHLQCYGKVSFTSSHHDISWVIHLLPSALRSKFEHSHLLCFFALMLCLGDACTGIIFLLFTNSHWQSLKWTGRLSFTTRHTRSEPLALAFELLTWPAMYDSGMHHGYDTLYVDSMPISILRLLKSP